MYFEQLRFKGEKLKNKLVTDYKHVLVNDKLNFLELI